MNRQYLKWGGLLGVIIILLFSACEQPTDFQSESEIFQSESEMRSLQTKSLMTGNQVIVLVHGFQGGGALGGSGSSSTNPGFSAEMGITQLRLDNNGQIIEEDLIQPYFLDENDEGLPIWLYDLGYDVWFAHYTSGPDGTDSLNESAANLSLQISQVKNLDADGKVDIIAASLGGLVSRHYLENTELYANDVEAIFTLGTPHKGMPVGLLLELGFIDTETQEPIVDITNEAMRTFNETHERAEGVQYYLIGGNAPIAYVDNKVLYHALKLFGDHDGTVLTGSALGRKKNIFDYEIAGISGRFETDETHGFKVGINPYMGKRSDGSLSTTFSIIESLLQ